MKSPSSLWMKVAIGFFIFVLVIVGLRILLWWKVHQEINALRERGIATTAAEFIAQLPQIPDEQNAAVQFLKAFNSLQYDPAPLFFSQSIKRDVLDEFNYFKTPTPSPEVLEDFGEFLALNEKPFADIHHALQLSDSIFQRNYSDGIIHAQPNPYLFLRQTTFLLSARAIYYAEINNPTKTFEAIQDSLRLGNTLKNDRFLVGNMIRTSLDNIAYFSLMDVMNRINFNDAQLAEIQTLIKSKENKHPLEHYLKSEYTALREIYKDKNLSRSFLRLGTLSTRGISPSIKYPDRWIPYHAKKFSLNTLSFLISSLGILDLNFLKSLEIQDEIMQACSLPPLEQIVCMENIATESKKLPFVYFTSRKTTPDLGNAIRRLLIENASIRCAMTMVAVERYRLKHKKLPDSLEQLAPEFIESVPLDPFDGKPLKYRKDGKSFYVYSIGKDFIDDGGDTAAFASGKNDFWHHKDIVFFIKRP